MTKSFFPFKLIRWLLQRVQSFLKHTSDSIINHDDKSHKQKPLLENTVTILFQAHSVAQYSR